MDFQGPTCWFSGESTLKPLFQQKLHGSWLTIFEVHEYPFPDPDRIAVMSNQTVPCQCAGIFALCLEKGRWCLFRRAAFPGGFVKTVSIFITIYDPVLVAVMLLAFLHGFLVYFWAYFSIYNFRCGCRQVPRHQVATLHTSWIESLD